MVIFLGIISVLLFLFGAAALIKPIPKLAISTRPRALLLIVSSFAFSFGAALFVETDLADVSRKRELVQHGGVSTVYYEFVSRAEYVGGTGIKVRVRAGLSKIEVGQVISAAADKYGGSEEVTVWVYRENDDADISGYTVAMGERSVNAAEYKLVFSESYFEGASDAHDSSNSGQPIGFDGH
ncbi:hypothetical protein [Parvibaculum sp.]|uniref:hypothetical protein n=1 Tax=Parvibaculum sp. TaxID=2024848 RepID=UPI003919CC92